MIALRLWWRMSRRQDSQRWVVLLALLAFAMATGALLTVLAGLGAFQHRQQTATDADAAQLYVVLAQVATVILVVPVLTLGGSAARLSTSRRNERLAALRLAGASNTQVGLIAMIDTAAQALAGAIIGAGLYLAAAPAVALIRFQGRAFSRSELWVGTTTLILVGLAVVALAAVSAAISLTNVIVSPLGVARRSSPGRVTWVRALVAVLVLAAWAPLMRMVQSVEQLSVILVVFASCFGVLNLLGPFVLGLIGKISARRAASVPKLLAARRLIDDPRSAWRSVAGVTLATFVAGVISIVPAISAAAAGGDAGWNYLPTDLMTGAMVTLVIAALLAAVSSGVNQTARVFDLADQYRMLHIAGSDVSVLKRIRLRETWLPLIASLSIAAGSALIIIAPIGIGLITATPRGPGMFVAAVVVCLTMVMGAVALSQPLVTRVAVPRQPGEGRSDPPTRRPSSVTVLENAPGAANCHAERERDPGLDTSRAD